MLVSPAAAVWFAQTSPTLDPAAQYTSLGVAGLICAVLTVVWRQAETRATHAETEVRELHRLRLEDRDRLLPLASDMVRTLGGATVALESKERRTLDDKLAGIEEVLADLRKKGQT